MPSGRPLGEVASLFLKLGTIGFGGPAAHIALMRDEVVRRRRWVSEERFLDLLGMTNLIPGPNSTEMAIHLGYGRAGWPGLLVGGACFIVPATLIVLGCAWLYVRWGAAPQATWLLYGVKPVIIAVVVQAVWSLLRTAVKGPLLPPIGPGFVGRLGWPTARQLLDAGAVGQFTPGPVFTTATFIGYVLGGVPGALLATLALFLPSFVFVALSHPLLPRVRGSAWAGAFLDGVNVAALGLMAVVTWELGRAAIVDPLTAGLALGAAILLRSEERRVGEG